MSRYDYSEIERQINKVLAYQQAELSSIRPIDSAILDERISESEALLTVLGYDLPVIGKGTEPRNKRVMIVPSWQRLCIEAEAVFDSEVEFESMFSEEELRSNDEYIHKLNEEFNAVHRLDKFDIAICVAAGLLGAAIDILFVGIPHKTPRGISAGKLSDYIRVEFEKRYPADEMEKLAASPSSKVPFDAQDNRHTTQYVEGLSAYYHRLLSLGHDPLIGLLVGTFDILTGRMTTIDKAGKVVSQVMENYTDRKESNIFLALAKLICHFKSDITTSMGLPAPLMGLFNFLQFGSIGEEDLTIAEIVQGMYYEGYDFIHFCSSSIPAMIVEIVVRVGYAIKRLKEGHSIKDSIPFSLSHSKNPKLATMLFIAHSAATAINAGIVYFSQNPLAINYPQWIAFAKYSFSQLKWALIQKPLLRERYVTGKLNDELDEVLGGVDSTFEGISREYIVVFE